MSTINSEDFQKLLKELIRKFRENEGNFTPKIRLHVTVHLPRCGNVYSIDPSLYNNNFSGSGWEATHILSSKDFIEFARRCRARGYRLRRKTRFASFATYDVFYNGWQI